MSDSGCFEARVARGRASDGLPAAPGNAGLPVRRGLLNGLEQTGRLL